MRYGRDPGEEESCKRPLFCEFSCNAIDLASAAIWILSNKLNIFYCWKIKDLPCSLVWKPLPQVGYHFYQEHNRSEKLPRTLVSVVSIITGIGDSEFLKTMPKIIKESANFVYDSRMMLQCVFKGFIIGNHIMSIRLKMSAFQADRIFSEAMLKLLLILGK